MFICMICAEIHQPCCPEPLSIHHYTSIIFSFCSCWLVHIVLLITGKCFDAYSCWLQWPEHFFSAVKAYLWAMKIPCQGSSMSKVAFYMYNLISLLREQEVMKSNNLQKITNCPRFTSNWIRKLQDFQSCNGCFQAKPLLLQWHTQDAHQSK
jgi:hypothetical protein